MEWWSGGKGWRCLGAWVAFRSCAEGRLASRGRRSGGKNASRSMQLGNGKGNSRVVARRVEANVRETDTSGETFWVVFGCLRDMHATVRESV